MFLQGGGEALERVCWVACEKRQRGESKSPVGVSQVRKQPTCDGGVFRGKMRDELKKVVGIACLIGSLSDGLEALNDRCFYEADLVGETEQAEHGEKLDAFVFVEVERAL